MDAQNKNFTDVIIVCDCDCGGRGASSKRKVKEYSGFDIRHITTGSNVINKIAWFNFVLGPETDAEKEAVEKFARRQPLNQEQRDIVKPLQNYQIGCWIANPSNNRMYKLYGNITSANDANGIKWVLEGYNGKKS